MNESTPNGDDQNSAAWDPYDYTDDRRKGDWKTSYLAEARKHIRWETAYLVIISIICLCGVFFIVSKSCGIYAPNPVLDNVAQPSGQSSLMFMGFVRALLAGTLGGCIFGIKFMCHFVAKLMWHDPVAGFGINAVELVALTATDEPEALFHRHGVQPIKKLNRVVTV
jgi:hypothetical protein